MKILTALISGLLFGIGLILAGMSDPAKVLGFLDVAGLWNPSLACVMGGAIGVGSMAFAFAKRRQYSFLRLPIQIPTNKHLDRRLIGGSLLFGIGWGLAGICPGPALVLIGSLSYQGAIFFLAMLAGMALFEWLQTRPRPQVDANAAPNSKT